MTAIDLDLHHPAPNGLLVQLSRRATDCAAAVNDGYSGMCSSTCRTHRSLTFGSIVFGMLLILLDSTGAA